MQANVAFQQGFRCLLRINNFLKSCQRLTFFPLPLIAFGKTVNSVYF